MRVLLLFLNTNDIAMKEEIKISRSMALRIRAALHTGGEDLHWIVVREDNDLVFSGHEYHRQKARQMLKLAKSLDKIIKSKPKTQK